MVLWARGRKGVSVYLGGLSESKKSKVMVMRSMRVGHLKEGGTLALVSGGRKRGIRVHMSRDTAILLMPLRFTS